MSQGLPVNAPTDTKIGTGRSSGRRSPPSFGGPPAPPDPDPPAFSVVPGRTLRDHGKTRPFSEPTHSACELLRTPETVPASMATYMLSSWEGVLNWFRLPAYVRGQGTAVGSSHSANAAYQLWPTNYLVFFNLP